MPSRRGRGSAIPITVMVPGVVPRVIVPAVVVTVPPASRLGLRRDECASEQKYDDRASDNLHGLKSPRPKPRIDPSRPPANKR